MAKRFKAAVIGGSGYGGAELIRRLLLHPDVELVRVASVDFIGEPLSAAHPNLEGLTDLKFEELTPAEAADGMDVVLLGLPHKVSAHKVPGDHDDRRAHRRPVGRLPPARRRRLREVLRRQAPVPAAARRHVRLRPARAEPRGDQRRRSTSPRPAASRRRSSSRSCRSRKAGLLDGRVEIVGITGSSGSGVAPTAGTHHPTRAVNLRTYKPLEHQHIPEIAETLHAAGAPVAAAPLRAGVRAAVARHLRDLLRARRRQVDQGRGRRRVRRDLPRRAVRARAAEAPARGRRGQRLELRRGRLRRRRRRSIPAPASGSSPASRRPTT